VAAAAAFVLLVSGSPASAHFFDALQALNTNAASDSGGDRRPQVATDGAGNRVAVWESSDSLGETIGTDMDILVARSTDAGANWTAPATLGGNAASDSGWDYAPRVATDGAGSWVAVWHSDDSLGASVGVDHDILVATGWGPDTDGDGYSDGDEVAAGSDPNDSNSQPPPYRRSHPSGAGWRRCSWCSRARDGSRDDARRRRIADGRSSST
jgi:hypothetical protein